MSKTRAPHYPLWDPSEAEGECKYIRLYDGRVLLIDPCSCAAHRDVAELLGVRGQVVSAGRVSIVRESGAVYMAERDSYTLGVKSAPGDEDARAIQAVVFGPRKAKRARASRRRD